MRLGFREIRPDEAGLIWIWPRKPKLKRVQRLYMMRPGLKRRVQRLCLG